VAETTLNYRIGQKIGRYEILQILGQGAMAIVYKAFDPYIDRTLAIKVLREERCIDSEYRMRFLREAKAAGNLSHPNIVTIYDIGEFESRPYIVMELLEGTPLDKLMDSGRKLSLSEIVIIGMQLAAALHYAHQNRVVHRDIKPSNIIFSVANNKSIQVKITDFGIAHITDSDLTQQTQTGAVLGTPYYISPEQVLGQKVDGRSDLFCLGVTLYHLFAGRRPFDGATFHTLLYQIATESPRPITLVCPDFPIQLSRIIDKLLEKNPDDRYATGNDLVDAFKAATDNINAKGPKRYKAVVFPFALKSVIVTAIALFLFSIISVVFVQQKQQALFVKHLRDIGVGYSQLIAEQSAESVLRADWLGIELFVNQTSRHSHIKQLKIIDHQGIIRGDSTQKTIGRPFVRPSKDKTIVEKDDFKVYALTQAKPGYFYGIKVPTIIMNALHLNTEYNFVSPIVYHKKDIGQVSLSLAPTILNDFIKNSLSMLMLIAGLVSLSAIFTVYWLTARISAPNKLIKKYLDEIAVENYSMRITKQRKDEIGELYSAYNKMADELQKRAMRKKAERISN